MIKFFRQIRQQLVKENKTTKYLLYAIGEIILVVIGILIALSINNWNDLRKDRAHEKILLQDMVDNLEINIQSLKNDIESLNQKNRSTKIVLDALNNKNAFSDTLRIHFHQARIPKPRLSLSNMSYQAMKDHGLEIVSNKNLANDILKLNEVIIPDFIAHNSAVNNLYIPFDNHIVQNFVFVAGEGLTPNDYESLPTDHFYISWTKAYSEGRKALIRRYISMIKEYERVMQLIRKELIEYRL